MNFNCPLPVTPLIATKTYLPQPAPGWVVRARLRERLNQAPGNLRRLVLVSALVGSGKSTLLADWVAATSLPCAWLSLNAQKKFIARFSANHQYVLDYLTSEVLAHLPEESY